MTPDLLFLIPSVVASSILLYAGLSKILLPTAIAETLTRLGLFDQPSLPAAKAVGAVEVVLALALCFQRNTLTAIALAVFAAGLAALGIYAKVSGLDIPCNCFGSSGDESRLGTAQIAQLPLWFGVAASLLMAEPLSGGLDGLVALATALIVATTYATIKLFSGLVPLRQQRLELIAATGAVS